MTAEALPAVLLLAFGCSEEKLEFAKDGEAATGGQSSAAAGAAGNGSGGDSNQGDVGGQGSEAPNDGRFCEGLPLSERALFLSDDAVACSGFEFEVEAEPVNIFIMMDRSSSMEYESESFGIRWDGIRNAVQSFVEHEDAAKLNVGLGFFSISGGSSESVDCNVDGYATPVVAIAPTLESGPSMVEAIESTVPSGLTPTRPALEGSIQYAREYYRENPNRDVVVALVTDGYPTFCIGDDPVSEIADVAAAGFDGEISVRTFVIGLEAGFNLDSIARSGGTGTAYHIDEEEDVTVAFLNRMLSLTTSATACKFEIPETDSASQVLDLEQVSLTFQPALGDSFEIPRVSGEAACERSPYGGWYFSDPENARKVALCPCNCGSIGGGVLSARVGCAPVILLY